MDKKTNKIELTLTGVPMIATAFVAGVIANNAVRSIFKKRIPTLEIPVFMTMSK